MSDEHIHYIWILEHFVCHLFTFISVYFSTKQKQWLLFNGSLYNTFYFPNVPQSISFRYITLYSMYVYKHSDICSIYLRLILVVTLSKPIRALNNPENLYAVDVCIPVHRKTDTKRRTLKCNEPLFWSLKCYLSYNVNDIEKSHPWQHVWRPWVLT